MIIDTYQKILECLGPSSSGTSGISSRATTPGGFPVPPSGFTASLSGSSGASGVSGISPALVDVVGKIDGRLKVGSSLTVDLLWTCCVSSLADSFPDFNRKLLPSWRKT